MKKLNKTALLAAILLLTVTGLIYFIITSTVAMRPLDITIIALILIAVFIVLMQAIKKYNEEKAGFPLEDELSLLIKYKSGYYAFIISMYMWLFIFLFRDKFPDVETMMGGGILVSGLLAMLTKLVLKHKFNEESN
jgi:hypothetical protein